MTLGQKLKYLRTMEKFPQWQLAEILNVERSTYAYYEKGKSLPDVYKLYVLARLYELPMEFFVNEKMEMDGAEAFLQAGAGGHGNSRSESALYVRERLPFYKSLLRRAKK